MLGYIMVLQSDWGTRPGSVSVPSCMVQLKNLLRSSRERGMGFNIDWNVYRWEQRGDKIAKHRIAKARDETALLADCPDWIADQIAAIYGASCQRQPVAEIVTKEFNHRFVFQGDGPDGLGDVVEVLSTVLSIPVPKHLDIAIALGWYTQPNSEGELEKAKAGYWINTTKHAPHPEWSNSQKSRREMIAALVSLIQTHPLYSGATAIIASPGHLADGQSFGEILAREVAKTAGIPFVETTAPGPRPEQKEGQTQDLTSTFTVTERLSGDVIVVDDVYRSGGSASGAAAAAKRAGARRVFALTVARTIRG